MKIDRKTIKATARLANVEIDEADIQKYEKEFNDILAYVEQLNELDIDSVSPTAYVQKSSTPMREDTELRSLPLKKALANHKDKKEPFFTVPKFIE